MRKPIIDRPFYLEKLKSYTESDIIRVITGVRRSGKSSLLLIYRAWLEEKYGKDCVIYLNFDGPDFIFDKSSQKMYDSIKAFATNKTRFMLLDEVQLMKGWENIVNAYYSTGEYEIVITGSNAKMLSSELATMLTGRYVEIEMFPLSFYEYSKFKSEQSEASLDKLFEEYLLYGGFPITALLDEPVQKSEMIKSILDSILFNDVKPKIGSDANNETLTKLIAFLNDAVGFPISKNNLMHRIKSSGYKMYTDLINKYMDAFISSFLYYNVEFHTVKGSERFGQTDKYYPVDSGFIHLTKGNMSENYGSLLENVVFLELKRRGMKISVGRNNDKSEVDFIATKGVEKIYIQVSATLADENTRQREFQALERINDNFPKLILSMDRHDFSHDGIKNIYIPDYLICNVS